MKKTFTLAILFFMVMVITSANTNAASRAFGPAEIKVIVPTDTILAICPPNDNYLVEPGETTTVKLYVRNAMANKSVEKLYLNVFTDERIITSQDPEYIEDLSTHPDERVKFFIISFTVPEDIPNGDYKAIFWLGTEEHETGSFNYEVFIKVRNYANELRNSLIGLMIIILLAILYRFLWILRTNRKVAKKKKRKKKKKKFASMSYYKKKKK